MKKYLITLIVLVSNFTKCFSSQNFVSGNILIMAATALAASNNQNINIQNIESDSKKLNKLSSKQRSKAEQKEERRKDKRSTKLRARGHR